MTIDQKRTPVFYGWVIVAVSFVTFALAYGTRYCFSVFYVAILNEFGWPRGTTATILSSHLMVYALTAPLAGGLMDRYGPRKLFPIGAVLIGLGLIVCSTASTILEFILYFGIVAGLGVSFVGTTPHSPVLANWFVKNKGLAIGIALSGVGCSFMLGIPSQWSISRFGWRASYIITGLAIILIVTPITAIFQRSRPEDKGLLPDGEDFLPPVGDGQANKEVSHDDLVVDKEWAATEWTLGRAARTHRFWALCCFNFLSGLAAMSVVTHQVRFAVDVGFSKMVAASAFGVYGVANLTGHAFGFVSDRIGREWTCSLGTAGMVLAALTLLQVNNGSQPWMLYLYSTLFGWGMGLVAVIFYASVADIFYGKHLGSIIGLIVTCLGVGLAIGPWLAGYIYDVTGKYSVAFVIAIIATVFSCFWLWIAAPRKVRLVVGEMRRRYEKKRG